MAKSSPVFDKGFGKTSRRDAWWVQGALTFLTLSLFLVYATWAAFQNAHYTFGPYLSPFYSPELWGSSPHAWFGPKPSWFPEWLPFSPALLILPFPAGFRFTCYYYRGAYYKAFWADPPACGVSEPRNKYTGEHGWPLLIQNIHRYFLYAALIFIVFLWVDTFKGFIFDGKFGIGVGSLVLLLNVTLLSFYTFSCHSLRHLVGGRKNSLANKPMSLKCYTCVSNLNKNHMRYAWLSLFGVMFADLYVRMCSMGIWQDFRIL